MADQIVDKRTVGIPPDILDVRQDTQGYRDDAQASEEEAAQSATNAAKSEASAALSASTAATLVAAVNGLRVGPEEPELHSRTEHMLWLETSSDLATVSVLRVWDAGAAGAALWPGESTYPGDSAWPMIEGTWVQARLGAACIA